MKNLDDFRRLPTISFAKIAPMSRPFLSGGCVSTTRIIWTRLLLTFSRCWGLLRTTRGLKMHSRWWICHSGFSNPENVHILLRVIFLYFQRAKLLRQKKEDGNNAFKSGRYSEAYDLYSEALNIDPNTKMTNAKLYFNRATVAAKVISHNFSLKAVGLKCNPSGFLIPD